MVVGVLEAALTNQAVKRAESLWSVGVFAPFR
jgi:hypothetical protein